MWRIGESFVAIGNYSGDEMYPTNYRYTREHEWIDVNGETGTIGITDYAQHELGDVVYVEMPKVGRALVAGKSLGTVESVKAVSEIYAPVGGEVTEVNDALRDKPELLNEDPQGKAWLIRLKITNASELSGLRQTASRISRPTSPSKERKPRPDALPPEKSIRASGDARGWSLACATAEEPPLALSLKTYELSMHCGFLVPSRKQN